MSNYNKHSDRGYNKHSDRGYNKHNDRGYNKHNDRGYNKVFNNPAPPFPLEKNVHYYYAILMEMLHGYSTSIDNEDNANEMSIHQIVVSYLKTRLNATNRLANPLESVDVVELHLESVEVGEIANRLQ